MMKRGRVLRDTNAGPGLLAVGGRQYSFTLEDMWQSELPPRLGMVVEVHFSAEGRPETVQMVPDVRLAKEQAGQAVAEARRHGETLTRGLRSRFRVPTLVAEAALLISFFLLPNMRVGNGFFDRSLNGWDAIGLDATSMATSDHGLLSLVAIVALLAPLAVPFVQTAWARWLNAAPVVFCVAAIVSIMLMIDHVGRAARQSMGSLFGAGATQGMPNPAAGLIHPALGAFAVLFCASYLLLQAVRRPVG